MRPSRIVALVIGCLAILPGLAMLFGGGALGLAYAFGRDDDGYFASTLERVSTDTAAVTSADIDLDAEPDGAGWVFDRLDVEVRLRATSVDPDGAVFLGIGPEREVASFLDGVAHDEITGLESGDPVYDRIPGDDRVGAPGDEPFWEVSAGGPGTQEIVWEPESGRWVAVLMNADGSPTVIAEVNVGAKAGFVLPLAIVLGVIGVVLSAIAVGLIVFGALGARRQHPEGDTASGGLPPPTAPQ